jgi:tRNA-dihydrouridine synthase B
MAGITDRDFRLTIRRLGGCGGVSMEFISAEGVVRHNPRTLRLLHYVEEERPIAVQVYGSEPRRMADAARVVEAIGADICDVNMGCPANKVLKGCAGAALAADLPRAQSVVRAIRAAIRIPLTVKFRLGLVESAPSFIELGRMCQEEGADAVTLHARTAAQQFAGHADWSRIGELKSALRIPVVGNGDVTSPEEAVRMFCETGCDAVMIGRASLTNPWIFRQSASLLRVGAYPDVTMEQRRQLMLSHFTEVLRREDARTALHKLRTFTGWYTHGIPDGRALRRRLSELPSAEAIVEATEEFFAARSAA